MFVSVISAITTLGNSTEVTQPQDAKPDLAILDDIEKYFKRFILLPDESLYLLASLWVLGTHLHQQFDFFGYLFVHSPEPQSGKSRLLELLREITFASTDIQIAPTPAVLFRMAANKTHLLDEVDGWTNKEELRNVLNAGFQKGRSVARMKEVRGSFVAEEFQVYAPRTLAGIGTSILDQTTRDRTFMIRMVRQKHTERREPFRPARLKPELDKLRKAVTQWVKENRDAVTLCYENAKFPYLQNFQDRTIDVSQPLAAILEIAYLESQQLKTVRERLVKAIGITRGEQQETENGHEILRALAKLASQESPLVGNASELAQRLHPEIDAGLTEHDVSDVLRKYDFKTKSTRLRGEDQPRYRYHLAHEALRDLCERYGGEEQPAENVLAGQ
jgi:hypothetical protein